MYEEPVAKKRRFFSKRVAISIVAGLASLGLLAGFFWLYSVERAATAPLRTSNAFLKSMFDKRIDEAYGLTSDIFQEETNKEQFTQVAESASKGLKGETLEPIKGQGAIEETDRGKLATITYEIEGNDGKYEMTVRLLKEQDKGWLIVGVENVKKS